MAEHAIVNASPLIFFCRSAHEDLLESFAGKLLVPQAVAAEILARGTQDPTARLLLSSPQWLSIVDAPPIPQEILDWGLGRGESEVLCVASAHGGVEAIIDDLAARKCAASIGVPVRGPD